MPLFFYIYKNLQTPNILKKVVSILLLLAINTPLLLAQTDTTPVPVSPIKWSYRSQKIKNNEYYLIFTATLDAHWYTYSQTLEPNGPQPTLFYFEREDGKNLPDTLQEIGNGITEHDIFFDTQVTKYTNTITFIAQIKTHQPNALVNGYIKYMSCNGKSCTPITKSNFTFEF